eukprot:NODE_860_length_1272_cov_308.394930_g655_i0.p1 GENE.NODE_860_length_1272_cov_308.394930_g655_i0~~NODE_860_length_1272_cov_308.394930_g655_i0.p1  ORF type:complete len:385 (-),score=77.98 NODE_860_length_1272_cov_308.394930_g655_i0:116-1183(-)
MYSLSHIAKAAPQGDCFIFAVRSSKCSPILGASNSNHFIKLYDTTSLQYTTQLRHRATISDFCFSSTDPNVLFSAESKTVQVWDLRSQRSSPFLAAWVEIDSLHVSCDGTMLAIGDGNDVVLRDCRQMQNEMARYSEFHAESVTAAQFHPTKPNILCTGSQDGLVNMLDIKAGSANDHEDVLVWVFNIFDPVERLTLCGDNYAALAATTSMESMAICSLESGDLLGSFDRQSEDTYIVGCLCSEASGGQLVSFTGSKLPENEGKLFGQSVGSGLSEVETVLEGGHQGLVRSIVGIQDTRVLASGAEDGTLCMWTMEGKPVSHPRKVTKKTKDAEAQNEMFVGLGKLDTCSKFKPY